MSAPHSGDQLEAAAQDALAVAYVADLAATGIARRIRLSLRLSTLDLAAGADVRPRTIRAWENGTAVPTGPDGWRYARELAHCEALMQNAVRDHEASTAGPPS